MEYEQIRAEVEDHVLTVTLNRPERLNAWTPTMMAELLDVFDRADADDEVRAVVLTGAGHGFCAGAGCSSWFLPRVVGISRAIEWVSTGRLLSAQEALDGGLVRSVHPAGELLEAAYALAQEIARNSAPVSVALARRMLWRMLGAEHPMRAHRVDSRAMFIRGQSADAREGISAFLEKRPAEFPDRVSVALPDVFPGWSPPGFE